MANSNNSTDPVYSYLKAIALLIVYLASLYEAQAQVHLVKDIAEGSGSSAISSLISKGNIAWFVDDNTGVWRTDGTAANTINIREKMGMEYKHLLKTENTLYAVSRIPTMNIEQLLFSDGTEEFLAHYYFNFNSINWLVELNGAVYFSADKDGSGMEIWKASNVLNTITMVADINAGAGGSFPSKPIVHNGFMFFKANDGIHGSELWRSDGTSVGTTMVKDIDAGVPNGNPQGFTIADGKLYFNAQTELGQELWVSDGTEEGTHIVADINPGAGWSNPLNLVTLNNIVYFFARDDKHGYEPWRSDGTEEGTYLLKDTHPATDNYLEPVDYLTVVNGLLYFSGSDGEHGVELWKSDGTEEGTVMVKDITPGSAGSILYWFTSIEDRLIFIENETIWKSKATECSTAPLLDETVKYSDSFMPVNAGDKIYFAGINSDAGVELLYYDLSTIDEGGCLQSITFEEIAPKKMGDLPFELSASSSVGLPVTFESGDESIASIDGKTVMIKAPGEVSITAKQNGNTDYKSATPVIQLLTIEIVTGTEDVDKLISVYPNPTTDYVFVEGSVLGDGAFINLTDINGNLLGSTGDNAMKLDVSNLPVGVYIVRVTTKDFSISKRIVKK